MNKLVVFCLICLFTITQRIPSLKQSQMNLITFSKPNYTVYDFELCLFNCQVNSTHKNISEVKVASETVIRENNICLSHTFLHIGCFMLWVTL